MGHNVRIIVPNPLEWVTPSTHLRERVINPIARKWGGCTVTRGFGYWNPEGTIVAEDVWVCDTSVPTLSPEASYWWEDLAAEVAGDWDQECVFLSTAQQVAYLVDKAGMTRRLGH